MSGLNIYMGPSTKLWSTGAEYKINLLSDKFYIYSHMRGSKKKLSALIPIIPNTTKAWIIFDSLSYKVISKCI